MSSAPTTSNPESTTDSAQQVKLLQQSNAELTAQVKNLQKQLDVFKQMLFGKRSEKRPFDSELSALARKISDYWSIKRAHLPTG